MKGNFYENERVALFIDGANLYSAARALGFDIDYRRLLKVFREKGRLVRAYYYTALVEDQEYSPIRPLVDWLDYNGFSLVTKPAREYTDANGRKRYRGDMTSRSPWTCWRWPPAPTTWCCSPATATSAGWW